MSFVESRLPPRLTGEQKPWNPFHNGWTSVRQGDWQWLGSKPSRVTGFGAAGVSVVGITKMLMGDLALPFGYPRKYWLGHVVGLSLGMWAGSAFHDLDMKSRSRIDLQREVLSRQRARDISELREAAERSMAGVTAH